MVRLEKLEKILFYVFVFALPFQTRVTLHQYGIASLAEYNSLFLYLTDALLVVLLALWAVRVLSKERMPISFSQAWRALHEIEPLYWFLIGFWVLTVLASFPPRSVALSLYQVIKTAEVILLFAYVTISFKRYRLVTVLAVFLAAVLFQSLIGFLQFTFEQAAPLGILGGSQSPPTLFVENLFLLRPYGTLSNPNMLAVFVSVALFLLFYLLMKRRFFDDYPNPNFLPKEEERALFKDSFTRIALLLLSFWLMAALVLTFSRTVILLFFAMLALDAVFLWKCDWFRIYQQRFLYIIAIVLGIMLLLGMLVIPEFLARTQPVVSLLQQNDHILDPSAVNFIGESPLFGVGAGYYVFKLHQESPDIPVLALQPVNNVYLLIASEMGLIALGFFVAFLLYLLYGLVKAYLKESDLTAKLWKSQLLILFLFVTAVSFFTHVFWVFQQGRLLYWLILAIMVATATEVKKEAAATTS